jgi:hypothetical protein
MIGWPLVACLMLPPAQATARVVVGPVDAGSSVEVPRPWSWPTEREHLEAGRILRDSRRAGADEQGVLVEQLARRGSAALSAWFDILEHQRVPEATSTDAPQLLSESQRGLLLSALARHPAPKVRALLLQRVESRSADEAGEMRLAAIRVLAVVGQARDLARLPAWAARKHSSAGSAPARLTREARTGLRDAAAGILARDPHGWRELVALVVDCDEHAARALLDGASSRRDALALEPLLRIVRARPAMALQVAALAPRCGRSIRPAWDAEFAQWAMERAEASPSEDIGAFLGAVGAFDEGALAPRLCALLDDPDRRVAAAALGALRAMVGLGLSSSAEWRAWLEGEVRWNEQVRPILARAVLEADEAGAARALQAYAGRRFQRSSLVADVVPALASRRPALRALACSTLGALHSAAATDQLVAASSDEDSTVRASARAALLAIHGEQLPDDLGLLLAQPWP